MVQASQLSAYSSTTPRSSSSHVCPACTFINEEGQSQCDICDTPLIKETGDDVDHGSSSSRPSSQDAAAEVPAPLPEISATNDNAGGQDTDTEKQKYAVGCIVEVARRMWPGINKTGGSARISSYNEDSGTYNVIYILGGREKDVDPEYIVSKITGARQAYFEKTRLLS